MTTPFLMMGNYEQAGKYIEMSTNSAGIAAEKLAVYQDSLAAKSAKASAAFESLSMTMINSGLVGAFYDMSAAILNMGAGLPDVVVNIRELSAALFALTTAYNALSASGVGASVRKTFSDLGWPEMTGDIVVPSYGEDAA